MHFVFRLAAVAALALGAANASAQSVTFNFEDGTDQGFRPKFTDPDTFNYTIANVGGSQRMAVPMVGGAFQQAEVRNNGTALGAAFQAAMDAGFANPTGYLIAYDYYIDTSAGNQGTFLQLGTYVNGNASGLYQQNFPGTNKELELNGTQLASGQVFQGTVSQTFAQKGFSNPPGNPQWALGLIINGDGTNVTVHYDDVRVAPSPNRPPWPCSAWRCRRDCDDAAAAVDRVRQFH